MVDGIEWHMVYIYYHDMVTLYVGIYVYTCDIWEILLMVVVFDGVWWYLMVFDGWWYYHIKKEHHHIPSENPGTSRLIDGIWWDIPSSTTVDGRNPAPPKGWLKP